MGKQLKTRAEYLTDFIEGSGSGNETNDEDLAAVAEAYFRLALHPSADPEKALVYLKKGYKIDNVDPRFAYHIALIYFQRKEFVQAGKWLMTAFSHCPTSHRIWVHIALLQNELNLEFNKQNQYRKDELKEKAYAINDNVINKSDSIDASLLKFEPSRADKASEIQIERSQPPDTTSSSSIKNTSLDSVRSFIEEMLKMHSQLLHAAGASEMPDKQLAMLDQTHRMLTEYGGKIDEHIEKELGFACRQVEKETDFKYILAIYKLFYFYLHSLLNINILRRKIKEKALASLRSQGNWGNQGSGINETLIETLESKFLGLEINTGRKSMELLELELDRIMEKLKSIRKIDKNKCRWPGVFDLNIENFLFNEASSLHMEKLVPLMEVVTGLSDKRQNGTSALAILCTEWLISGYSPQSIKRILDDIVTKQDDEFTRFIGLLSNLFECESEELPGLLAVHLKDQYITPLLAALVLKKRYLWREIDFEKNFEFKKSVNLLNSYRKNKDLGTDESEINQNIKILLDGVSGMWNPRKVPSIVQDPNAKANGIRTYSYEETCEIFERLENAVRGYNNLTERLQGIFLKDFRTRYTAISTAPDYAYVLEHFKALQKLEDIYAGFVRGAKELKKDVMSGLKKDIGDNLKKTLSDRESHLTSELNDLKGCPQILKNIEKNLVANASLNDDNKESVTFDQNLDAILVEAASLLESVLVKPGMEENLKDGINVFERFIELEKTGLELRNIIEDLQVRFLKDFRTRCAKIDTQDEYSYVISCVENLKKINISISGVTKASISEIGKVSGGFRDADESKKREFISSRERISNMFRDIESMSPKPDKYESKVTALGNKFEKLPVESDQILVDINARIQKICNELLAKSDIQDSGRNNEGQQDGSKLFYDKIGFLKSEELKSCKSGYSGIDGLEKTINLVGQEIENLLNYSLESFQHFDKANLQNPYLIDLQTYFLNQTAETYFRIGYYKKAIKYWQDIILLKEIDPSASRNVAIAETMIGQNDQKVLDAWRKHCEDLYRCDIIISNPGNKASERAELHSKLSSVYAPFLSKAKDIRLHDPEEYQVYQQQFIALINNPSRFYEYMIHKLAELFNRRYTFRSPVLFLGLQINADSGAVKKASGRMEIFIRSLCSALPEKVKSPFLDLCLNHLKRSVEFCLVRENMTLAKNPSYEEDKKKLQEWIKTVLELKEMFFLLLRDYKSTDDDLKYLDMVFIIDLVNKLPVDIDKEILEDISVSAFAVYRDPNPAELTRIFASNIIHIPLIPFLQKITATEDSISKRIHSQLTRILSGDNFYIIDRDSELIGLIDYPYSSLPDFVTAFIEQKTRPADSAESKRVIDYLEKKCRQIPEISIFPRLLAGIDFEKGKGFLKSAIPNALNRKIKLGCIKAFEIGTTHSGINLARNLFDNRKFEDAFKIFINLFDKCFNKKTIPEKSIIDNTGFTKETKNDLFLIAGLNYKDPPEIEALIRTELGIEEKESLEEIMKLITDADTSFLAPILSNIIAGWTNSDPGKATDHLEEFCTYWIKLRDWLPEEPEVGDSNLRYTMDQLLVKASIASLGTLDNEYKVDKAASSLENLIRIDDKNYYAVYYLAHFKKNLGDLIAKRGGLENAKESYRVAYIIISQLKAVQADMEDNLKSQINQLFDSLDEHKDMFIN